MYKLFCKQILEINNEEYVLIYDIDDEIDNINKGNSKSHFNKFYFDYCKRMFTICSRSMQ